MTDWNELLAEFRALGGTADNIRLGRGEFGRGLFPIDPARPVAVRIPENLLVAQKDMIFVNGVPRVGPGATVSDRERRWLDRYLEEISWGDGGADEVKGMFEAAGALPAELRHALQTEHFCGSWFAEPTEALIQDKFLDARAIDYRGKAVMMPVVELINHGPGRTFDLSSGVAVRGTFSGEVLVHYAEFDSYDFFLAWGFAVPRPQAFSMALAGTIQSTRLDIEQDFPGSVSSERSWIPKIEKNAGGVSLNFLMIGNQLYPRLCKGIFYRLMRNAGYSGFEECFDVIQHSNRLHFLNLLRAVDGIDLPIARTLRAMAHHQLRAMSFCFGVREI